MQFAEEPPVYKGYVLGTTLGNIEIPCSVTAPAQFRYAYTIDLIFIENEIFHPPEHCLVFSDGTDITVTM